jgi:hypothetical protein
MSPVPRREFLARSGGGLGLAGLASVAGCLDSSALGTGASGDGEGSEGVGRTETRTAGGSTPTVTEGDAADSAALSGATSVLPTRDERLPLEWSFAHLRDRTLSGGPPKDGIPSIDDPTFGSVAEADGFLAPGDVVFGVAGEEGAKAYPQRILVWHEIVNDVVDGECLGITYCPLTGTALGFRRGETTFGVSGKLVNSNLVMYDRETDSRWPQVLGTAISGPFEGRSLREVPVTWTTWERWTDAHPNTVVLTEDTGYVRNYNDDPYGQYDPPRGYYATRTTLFAPLSTDGRFHEKEVFVGARPSEGPIAFRKASLRERGLLTVTVGGTPFHAVYDPGLDTAYVYRGDAEVTYANGRVSVGDSGSEGVAPDALPLESVVALDAMWFAWAGFYPGTAVIE